MNAPLFNSQPASSSALTSSVSGPALSAGHTLLTALWPSSDRVHQIAVRDSRTGHFRNIPVNGVADAVSRAVELSDAGSDAYFAPAEYRIPDNRKAANVTGAAAVWFDIDCGEGKAADGKGYATVNEAEEALLAFCLKVGLPDPTHIVYSGGGLHVYFALDHVLLAATWSAYATKLKGLTKAHGLLADDTRTADIASVLRVPGTPNYKYTLPRSVLLKKAAPTPIPTLSMLDAIERAHAQIPRSAAPQPSRDLVRHDTAEISRDPVTYGPPDLAKLASALGVLDPDCDEWMWKLKRIAPIAREARNFPEMREALYKLARSWSSGELRGEEAKAWFALGGNGRTGEVEFDAVWARFLKPQTYAGKETTLGTIYHEARAAGWTWSAEFSIVQDDTEAGA